MKLPEASPLKPVWFTPARRHRLGFFYALTLLVASIYIC
jgi:hypothetical protein